MPSIDRIVYLGNGPFARPALATLLAANEPVVAVVARPDRPQGKHQEIVAGPVANLAQSLGLQLHQPEDVNDPAFLETLRSLNADLLVVADFGQLLSPDCLAGAREGGVNIHGSLLPKYRGAAPIAWAVIHGETETGVSIIRMTPRLDAGGVILQGAVPIGPDQTAGELELVLADLGAQLALDAVRRIRAGTDHAIPQDPARVTKAPRLKKEDGRIRWERSAQQIHDQVRALIPWPIAFGEWRRAKGAAVRIQFLKTRPLPDLSSTGQPPGTVSAVSDEGIQFQTGAGQLRLLELRPAGKPTLPVREFLRGNRVAVGDRFE